MDNRPDAPQGAPPIALAPATFARHEAATRYVENVVRTRQPWQKRNRSQSYRAATWGLLRSGDVITAASGLVLGQGYVELCDQDGPDLTPNGDVVLVYNGGAEIDGGTDAYGYSYAYGDEYGTVLPLVWRHGHWTVDCCGSDSSSGASADRCACPEDSYEVEVDCGDCGAYYGPTIMPRFWWLTISDAGFTAYGDAYPCSALPCGLLAGKEYRLTYAGGCLWTITNGALCVSAELRVSGDYWQITLLDREDCVLAILRLPLADFNCCGRNAGWTSDPDSPCNLTVSLAPDACTCCPDATCPPADEVVCRKTDCCLDKCNCHIAITVQNLYTPALTACTEFDDPCYDADGNPCPYPVGDPGRLGCFTSAPDPAKACGGMNGVYGMAWAGDCTWTFVGVPAGGSAKVKATLALDGRHWYLHLEGDGGQYATFELADWDCAQAVTLAFTGGSCPDAGPTIFATFNLCISVD